MRLNGVAVLALIAGTAVAQTPSDSNQSRVEGLVISALTKQPLRGATVKLQKAETTMVPVEAAYTTVTDDAGRFIFRNPSPSAYWLVAERPGYLREALGGAPGYTTGKVLDVGSGKVLSDLTLPLAPQATIAGKLVDEAGEPIGEGRVSALILPYGHGVKSLVLVSSANVNVAGGFVVGSLAPGRYYLRVDPNRTVSHADTSPAATDHPEEANIPTYYPHSPGLDGAAPVDVTAGSQMGGIDVVMRRSQVFRIRGKVSSSATTPVTMVSLAPKSYDLLSVVGRKLSQVDADGEFQFNQVPPGEYVVEPDRLQLLAGRADIDVGNRNLDDVALTVQAPSTIAGKVELVDVDQPGADVSVAATAASPAKTAAPTPASAPTSNQPPTRAIVPPPPPVVAPSDPQNPASAPPAPAAAPSPAPRPATDASTTSAAAASTQNSQAFAAGATPETAGPSAGGIRIVLHAADRIALFTPMTTTGSDGSFRLESVGMGRYNVDVSPMPAGAYLKSVSYNQQPLSERIINNMSGGGGVLDVVLSAHAAEVDGTMHDPNGAPLAGVVVSAWNSNPLEQGHTATTDSSGAFRIGNLAPGKYMVVAWQDIMPGLARDRQFCDFFAGQAETVELGEKGHASVSPKLIPKDSITAEMPRIN